eukprot:gene36276-22857_t
MALRPAADARDVVLHFGDGAGEAELLVGWGKPHGGAPLHKVIGYGGALVNATEDGVRADVARYEADPDRFG